MHIVSGVVLGLTLAAIVGPAYLGGEAPRERAGQVLALLPSATLGFLLLAIFTAIASAGGREVVPRDQAVAFPVSTTTDHLGALVLAPLNIAWIMQAWMLLGMMSYALGPEHLWAYELPVLLWILAATALAQAVGWLAEGVRRGPHGIAVVPRAGDPRRGRSHGPGRDGQPRAGPRREPHLAAPARRPRPAGRPAGPPGLIALLVITVIGLASVVVGAIPARWALQRPMREELRLESGRYPARPTAVSDLAMMLRIDRAAVWRSVPLRRGMTVLALMPGVVALAGDLEWQLLTVLPGLVASGGALLFGVNTWCLDGRGALWRDSLPVSPTVSFLSRVVVLMEVLLASAALTLVLAALRAGRPTAAELVALLCCTLVVTLQVVGCRDALEHRPSVRGRPAQRPRHPRAARGDGGLQRPAGGGHHDDRSGLLRPGHPGGPAVRRQRRPSCSVSGRPGASARPPAGGRIRSSEPAWWRSSRADRARHEGKWWCSRRIDQSSPDIWPDTRCTCAHLRTCATISID